jgi:hypothetical protein
MTQPNVPNPHHQTLDPTPVPADRRGTEAPVDNTHPGSDIGGTKAKD